MELLFMDPVFKEAIWGGTKLRDVFDYEIPSDTTGECWAISGHANGMSHVAGGRFDGKTLGELWKEEPEIFGNYPGSQGRRVQRGRDLAQKKLLLIHH